ncbi:MAG: 4-phosphoerythronate dehydrogenase [Lentisphaeria bacterium]|nr:4-phosphoerythronate dehydrogenase [Lentisphaeria bacterium]
MKIVADNKIPFLKGVFEPFAEVVYLPGKNIDREAVKECDALITRTRTQCTKELLAGSRIKHIATATIGFDHIAVPEVEALGITWNNAPGCNANSVGQYMTAALLSLDTDLENKTLGVIGVGHVGTIVARYAEALGMKVLRNDPPRADAGEKGFVSLEEVLESSDMVTLHVPLEYTGKYPTFHMADETFFSRLRKGAVFFNASRGEAVETEALKKALQSGRVSRSIIDVWENEPDIDLELMQQSFISTMHIAGYSTDGKVNGTTASVRAVARALGIKELEQWTPSEIPAPLEAQEIPFVSLKDSVLHTYSPLSDSARLRNAPENFEELRGSYPRRREFQAFKVVNAPEKERKILAQLGFQVG